MTVSTTENRKSYAGNGVTSVFSFPYVFFADADLVVLLIQADGTFTQKVLGTDYTVTGAGVEAGGAVTMTAPPAAGTTLVVYRDPQVTQPQAFVDNDPLPAKSISRGYDRLTVISQRIRELVSRSFRLSDADTSGASPILPAPTPNAFIGWNSLGNGLVNRSITDLITISAYGTAVADKFTGDGVKVDFTLSANPGALANLDVSIGGITQTPVRDFTWDGATKLSFVAAPPAPTTPGDTNIYVRYLRALPQGTADASVTYWKDAGGTTRDVQGALQMLTGERFNVKDPRFGAKGDGSTDDTAAIQAALNAAAASGGRVVFPPGAYKCSAPISVPLNVDLLGAGLLATKVRFTHTGDGFVSACAINGSTAANVSLSEMTVECTNAGNAGAGFAQTAGTYVDLYKVVFTGWKYGVIFDQTEIAAIRQCQFANNTVGGVWLVNGPTRTTGAANTYTNRITIEKCQFNANPVGIIDDGGVSHSFEGNNFNGGAIGIYLAGAFAVSISGANEIEYCTQVGIKLGSTRYSDGSNVGQCNEVHISQNLIIAYGAAGAFTGAPCIQFLSGLNVALCGNEYQSGGTTSAAYAVQGVGNIQTLTSLDNRFSPPLVGLLDNVPSVRLTQNDDPAAGNRLVKTQFYAPVVGNAALLTYNPTSAGGGTTAGGIGMQANNGASAATVYGYVEPAIYANTPGAESGAVVFSAPVAGVKTRLGEFNSLGIVIRPGASVGPTNNGDAVFELTNNTTLKIKVKGSDGVVRSTTLTLA